MNRLFKIARRRPHIVDFYTPFKYGLDTAGYRIKWGQNFDTAVPAMIINSTNIGFLDDNVNRNVIETQPTTGTDVRIVFDPTTYSIDDSKPFWLTFAQIQGAAEVLVSAPTLILPDSANKGVGLVTIRGTTTASLTPQQIDLPFLMADFRIHNEEPTNYLYVATEAGGPEQQLRPDTVPQVTSLNATQGSLYVRGATAAGAGVAVTFSASFTLAFPK
jgi:hypothetical protein